MVWKHPWVATWTPGPISMKLTGDLPLTRVRVRGRFPVSFEGPAVKVRGAHMQPQSLQPTVSMEWRSATGAQAMHPPPACMPVIKVRGAHIALMSHHPTVSMEWHLAAGAWAMHPGMPAMKVWGAHMQPPTVSMEQRLATGAWAMPAMVMLPRGSWQTKSPPNPKFPGRDWDKGLSGLAPPRVHEGSEPIEGPGGQLPRYSRRSLSRPVLCLPHSIHHPCEPGEVAVRPPGAVSPQKPKWSDPHKHYFGSGQGCGEVCCKDGRWMPPFPLEQCSPE